MYSRKQRIQPEIKQQYGPIFIRGLLSGGHGHVTHVRSGSVHLVGSWFVKIIVPILFGSKDFVSDPGIAAFIAERFTFCARHLCRQLD